MQKCTNTQAMQKRIWRDRHRTFWQSQRFIFLSKISMFHALVVSDWVSNKSGFPMQREGSTKFPQVTVHIFVLLSLQGLPVPPPSKRKLSSTFSNMISIKFSSPLSRSGIASRMSCSVGNCKIPVGVRALLITIVFSIVIFPGHVGSRAQSWIAVFPTGKSVARSNKSCSSNHKNRVHAHLCKSEYTNKQPDRQHWVALH